MNSIGIQVVWLISDLGLRSVGLASKFAFASA